MTFIPAQSIVPVAIGGIRVTLYTNPNGSTSPETTGLVQQATYEVEVLDALGGRIRVAGDIGDLVPHLTSVQISALLQFMADLRVKAETEFLGG